MLTAIIKELTNEISDSAYLRRIAMKACKGAMAVAAAPDVEWVPGDEYKALNAIAAAAGWVCKDWTERGDGCCTRDFREGLYGALIDLAVLKHERCTSFAPGEE